MTLRIAQDYRYVGNDQWDWWVWLDGDVAELNAVEAVEYRLHPSFPNPVKVVTDRNTQFRLDATGWGVFQLTAKVRLVDGSAVHLAHMLKLSYPEDGDDTPAGEPLGSALAPTKHAENLNHVNGSTRRPSVFLSCGFADNDLAAKMSASLIARGLDVGSDIDFEPGQQRTSKIEQTIGSVDAMVVLSSDIPSKWVEYEVDTALKLGVKVITVVVGPGAVVYRSLTSVPQIQMDSAEMIDAATDSILKALFTGPMQR